MQGNSMDLFGEPIKPNRKHAPTLICTGCNLKKPVSEFPNDGRSNLKTRQKYCRACNARTEKPCAKCGIVQPVDTGYCWKQGRGGKLRRDNTCRRCRAQSTREWAAKVGKRRRNRGRLLRTYGITEIAYQSMIESQAGACAICGEAELPIDPRTQERYDLAVDHDHETGKVRALLCPACNNGLGCFKDDPKRLHLAISYLKKHATT